MEENMIKRNMWNEAGKAGLALGAVSTAYLFTTQFLAGAEIPAIINMLLATVLWVAKFGGCIWLMKFFMQKFAADNPGVDNRDTRRFGVITALLSAFVYSAMTFVNIAFISADMFAEQTDTLIQQMASTMDSNTLSFMDLYLENLPTISFVTNLVYCFTFGAILSAILSRNIPNRDPFANYKPEDQ